MAKQVKQSSDQQRRLQRSRVQFLVGDSTVMDILKATYPNRSLSPEKTALAKQLIFEALRDA